MHPVTRRRRELGLTMRDLATRAALSTPRQVWRIEHGVCSVRDDAKRRIARALDASVESLFFGEEGASPATTDQRQPDQAVAA